MATNEGVAQNTVGGSGGETNSEVSDEDNILQATQGNTPEITESSQSKDDTNDANDSSISFDDSDEDRAKPPEDELAKPPEEELTTTPEEASATTFEEESATTPEDELTRDEEPPQESKVTTPAPETTPNVLEDESESEQQLTDYTVYHSSEDEADPEGLKEPVDGGTESEPTEYTVYVSESEPEAPNTDAESSVGVAPRERGKHRSKSKKNRSPARNRSGAKKRDRGRMGSFAVKEDRGFLKVGQMAEPLAELASSCPLDDAQVSLPPATGSSSSSSVSFSSDIKDDKDSLTQPTKNGGVPPVEHHHHHHHHHQPDLIDTTNAAAPLEMPLTTRLSSAEHSSSSERRPKRQPMKAGRSQLLGRESPAAVSLDQMAASSYTPSSSRKSRGASTSKSGAYTTRLRHAIEASTIDPNNENSEAVDEWLPQETSKPLMTAIRSSSSPLAGKSTQHPVKHRSRRRATMSRSRGERNSAQMFGDTERFLRYPNLSDSSFGLSINQTLISEFGSVLASSQAFSQVFLSYMVSCPAILPADERRDCMLGLVITLFQTHQLGPVMGSAIVLEFSTPARVTRDQFLRETSPASLVGTGLLLLFGTTFLERLYAPRLRSLQANPAQLLASPTAPIALAEACIYDLFDAVDDIPAEIFFVIAEFAKSIVAADLSLGCIHAVSRVASALLFLRWICPNFLSWMDLVLVAAGADRTECRKAFVSFIKHLQTTISYSMEHFETIPNHRAPPPALEETAHILLPRYKQFCESLLTRLTQPVCNPFETVVNPEEASLRVFFNHLLSNWSHFEACARSTLSPENFDKVQALLNLTKAQGRERSTTT